MQHKTNICIVLCFTLMNTIASQFRFNSATVLWIRSLCNSAFHLCRLRHCRDRTFLLHAETGHCIAETGKFLQILLGQLVQMFLWCADFIQETSPERISPACWALGRLPEPSGLCHEKPEPDHRCADHHQRISGTLFYGRRHHLSSGTHQHRRTLYPE